MVRIWQIVVLALAVVSCCESLPALSVDKKFSRNFVKFEDFRRNFGKSYSSPKEALERFQVFAKNLEKIDQLNRMEKGIATYGINEMADWTEEEFLTRRANLNSAKLIESLESAKLVTFKDDDNKTVPDSKDWRSEGKVTPVKDQGQCGSCWAFSVVALLESVFAISKNGSSNGTTLRDDPLMRFSEQQLVDCDTTAMGCNGGWPENTIDFIIEEGGIMTEDSYPYTGKDGNCSFSSDDVAAKVTERIPIPSGDEEALERYVGLESPTSTAINANLFQFYKSGIIRPSIFCLPFNETLNHAVSIVGYNQTSGSFFRRSIDYWIVKNSWGESWGEKGYARVQKGSNTCGIANVNSGLKTE